jgi:hypothetical protein
MCMTVHHVDLGPADALADLKCGRLVIRPSLTPRDQIAAAKQVMAAAGIRQEWRTMATCRCGGPLDPVSSAAATG